MAEHKPTGDAIINWGVVGFGGVLLALAVAAIPQEHLFVRVLAAVAIYVGTLYLSQSGDEPEVENPVLEQLRSKSGGLDRRKYGRLRSATERMLEQVRNMNRVAIEGREGKIAPRHAQAELDRLAAQMRDLIDGIRKSAGVPTPVEEAGRSGKVVQPQIVMPRASRDNPSGSHITATDETETEEEDETEKMLDELEAQAEAAAADSSVEETPEGEEPEPPEEEKKSAAGADDAAMQQIDAALRETDDEGDDGDGEDAEAKKADQAEEEEAEVEKEEEEEEDREEEDDDEEEEVDKEDENDDDEKKARNKRS
ncbi:MAG: hypothetical protein GWN99_14895 [Gemmatimonadetes bacterium]|uniref:Uncharacterized protein n=1 Tax=Candidatus Kutchimonas denitrificans TaxID=3056748 RepID=A0AAE4ZC27_9BACT|nr:hypothetical protein [Gemmatimonadota bacterium]NIR76311.1 hypothetical protein [Candidatus Kutchimonas denitrificans]NIS02334.1 hypothetical protein [Gemmatimonadota bacterium]NIT68153.1 hypothetical protein [Gemmatimonadota bacterium]NIU54377.1 hypothetical protein [Gemmatimonadota bacterium]